MRINSDYMMCEVAGENVILLQGDSAVDTTKLLSLNETSAWLWEQLNGKTFVADTVAELIVNEFEVDKNQALADANIWIETLSKYNLILA